MTQASLYNTHSAAPEKTENTQDTLYYSKTPVLLLINSDQLHSGHNDLLQDRRWLGKKISKHVKILIVGAYSELTSDVQNRVEATYLD